MNEKSSKDVSFYGIILAAGIGSRMNSKFSKVFLPFLGKTILENVIDNLKCVNLEGIIVVISPNDYQKAKEMLGERVKIVIQEKPLGTADAVKSAIPEINSINSNLIILCGDTPLLKTKTINNLINEFISNEADVSILTSTINDPKQYGRIVRESNNDFKEIVEFKDTTAEIRKINEINSGTYIFKKDILKSTLNEIDKKNAANEYYFTDALRIIKENKGKIVTFCINGENEIFGINTKKDLTKALKIGYVNKCLELIEENGVIILDPDNTFIDRDVLIGRDSIIKPYCVLEGNIEIGEETSVGPFVSMRGKKGKIIIGNNCLIGPFTSIREGTIIEDEAHLGSYVELKKVKFGKKSKSMHLTYLGDSEIGENVNIGAGTITCNYDGYNKNVTKIEDNVFIGSDTIIVPPLTIKKGSYTAAGSTITEDVPENSLGISRTKQINKENWAIRRRNREDKSG